MIYLCSKYNLSDKLLPEKSRYKSRMKHSGTMQFN